MGIPPKCLFYFKCFIWSFRKCYSKQIKGWLTFTGEARVCWLLVIQSKNANNVNKIMSSLGDSFGQVHKKRPETVLQFISFKYWFRDKIFNAWNKAILWSLSSCFTTLMHVRPCLNSHTTLWQNILHKQEFRGSYRSYYSLTCIWFFNDFVILGELRDFLQSLKHGGSLLKDSICRSKIMWWN